VATNSEILEMAEIIRNTVPTDRIYLFGSHAYGTPNEHSDYDFYVVLADADMRPYEAVCDIRRALRRMNSHASVDILALSAERFDDRKRLLTLERKVANEGVLLYERDSLDKSIEPEAPELEL
jgi:predicted nucleotidyltransferase